MMNKLFTVFTTFVILMIVSMMVFIVFSTLNFPKLAEEKCEKVEMEVFEALQGSLFTESSITCWNPETKEVKKIR